MKVELTQAEWQNVLALLARSPYNEVAQLIQSIAQQLQAPPAADKPHFREVTNG